MGAYGVTMANKQSQITITNLQLKELARSGKTTHTRSIGGFNITFEVALDDKRKPYCVGASVSADNLPLVGFPDMLATGFVVPMPKGDK